MSKSKVVSLHEAVSHIKDGDVIHFGGFYAIGTADDVIDEILRQGQKNLTVVNNDGNTPTVGVGRLIAAGRVKKFICSWCGLLPMIPEMVDKGELELELNPQGTLAERIRAAGFGLGGILTPTGVGTMVEQKWGQRVTLNGKDWLYHTPLRANVSVLEAYQADEAGNLIFHATQNNFNQVMAYAGDYVIASVIQPIVKKGTLNPDYIQVQGPIVDALVQKEVK